VSPRRTGVFGGTFDPIHLAHLALAEAAREAADLDQVLFVPAAVQPFKQDVAMSAPDDRLAMVELAIAGNPAFATSRVELERAGPSYTVDTLAALAADPANGDLSLILSAETFLQLPRWRDPDRIVRLAELIVAPRDGYPEAGSAFLAEHFGETPVRARFLDGPRLRISASELRSRAAAGHSLRYLVPDAVAAYIGDHGLYRPDRRDDRT
jgi:nicotinate-nucleotide adenylyltransferase